MSDDQISRQAAIDALDGYILDETTDLYGNSVREILEHLPSAQPEQPPYVAEIESEYRKAVNNPYIKKPLAKALYEVWKKHDRDDAERRVTDGGLDKQTGGDRLC